MKTAFHRRGNELRSCRRPGTESSGNLLLGVGRESRHFQVFPATGSLKRIALGTDRLAKGGTLYLKIASARWRQQPSALNGVFRPLSRSKQFRNGVEGDAGGRGLEGGEHGGGRQRAEAVFVVQRVHGGQQARAALLVFGPSKRFSECSRSGTRPFRCTPMK